MATAAPGSRCPRRDGHGNSRNYTICRTRSSNTVTPSSIPAGRRYTRSPGATSRIFLRQLFTIELISVRKFIPPIIPNNLAIDRADAAGYRSAILFLGTGGKRRIPSVRKKVPAMSERIWNPNASKTYADFERRFAVTDSILTKLMQQPQVQTQPPPAARNGQRQYTIHQESGAAVRIGGPCRRVCYRRHVRPDGTFVRTGLRRHRWRRYARCPHLRRPNAVRAVCAQVERVSFHEIIQVF